MSQGYLNDDGGLRVWFRDEIRNALLSAWFTVKSTTDNSQLSQETDAFRRGYLAAIIAIGLNFGIVIRFGDDGLTATFDPTASEKK